MNISTGGPHILLFERDQQLAVLLTSELQLAGYECHTARTAVEVFDAIARHPVRLVLVNLAQAAAARREFWVALDTQRRGSGVQVLTFYCSNLAGYGPRDPDEQNQATLADMEIDGMSGLMSLVDAVRTRVPGATGSASTMPHVPDADSLVSTMPRMPRVASSNATVPMMAAPRPGQPLPATEQNNSGTAYRSDPTSNRFIRPTVMRSDPAPAQPAPMQPSPPQATPATTFYVPPASVPETNSAGQGALYNEKIRAVLYPSQRSWSSGTNNATAWADAQMTQAAQGPGTPATPSDSMLQRLANGQIDPGESGLEQLSRLAGGYPVPSREEYNRNGHQPATEIGSDVADSAMAYTPNATVRAFQSGERSGPLGAVTSPQRPIQNETPISTQPMRPAPIQDLPLERTTPSEGARRLDVLARSNYGAQSGSQLTHQSATPGTPLASIATAATTSATAPLRMPMPAEQTTEKKSPTQSDNDTNMEMKTPPPIPQTQPPGSEENDETVADQNPVDQNSVILDILQSLPPILDTPQPQQGIQPQVLNGRATRSLGSVLLDGHLVPQDRLEVAQNIQRMLRGVDLNYQLGDILLMFKLLTPDQLLAASLVSYGLITTTQISALGRIRQELHSIGLEYDLENLVILFRILTPEQLREVRANVQN